MNAGHVRTCTADDVLIAWMWDVPDSSLRTLGHVQDVEATFRSPGRVAYRPLHPASCIFRIEDIRSWRPEGRQYVGSGGASDAVYVPFAVWPGGSRK
jgi:hypothetical protein